jgi:hypothetical protein
MNVNVNNLYVYTYVSQGLAGLEAWQFEPAPM